MNVPNLLSLARLPLTVLLAVCISYGWWLAALTVFALAALTDWLDGWWARHFQQQSALGRSLDPLTDKVLIATTLIFLQAAGTAVQPWMVAVIIARELLVTGLRGAVESAGVQFPADWFGKLKTLLQMLAIAAILAAHAFPSATSHQVSQWLLVMAVLATIGSGMQYGFKAAWRTQARTGSPAPNHGHSPPEDMHPPPPRGKP